MFHNHRFSKEIIENFCNNACVHGRYLSCSIKIMDLALPIPVKTHIQSLVGGVAPAPITPPFFRRLKHHARRKDPFIKPGLSKAIGTNEKLREASGFYG
jgi:hypothetical protein